MENDKPPPLYELVILMLAVALAIALLTWSQHGGYYRP